MKIKLTLIFLISNLLSFSQINFEDKTTLIDDTHNTYDINSIAIADLDNNNWKDLIITSYDDKIMWYKNVNGDFRHFQRNIISINQIDIPKYITAADLNNDGLLDLIVVNDSSVDKIFWFENLGNGNFSSEILISDSINGASSIETIDIDNDGDIDILTGGATKTVILIENNNDETFQNPLVIYEGSSFTRQVRSNDLNNDGLSDIISSHSNGTIYWAENLGNNVFGNREYITGSSDNGSALDFIDANEDGYLDIVTANNYSSSDNVRYILNQNGNSFDNNNPVIIDNSIHDPYRVGVKDIDNDGKDDIVVSFWTNDNMSWYRNLGNGNFSTANLISDALINSKSFAIEDTDNDGLNDIISSSNLPNEGKLSLFKNENNGTNFDETIIHHSYGLPYKVKISDLNNDNQNDIIVAAKDIIWFENYGTDFSSYKVISSNNPTNAFDPDIIIEDINNDGYKDIVGFYGNDISILTNDNDETFTEQIFQYSTTSTFKNPIYADFDGDNLKDVLVSIPTSSEHKIGFIKRLNYNSFGPLQIIDIPLHNGTTYYKIFDMALNDIENDGDIDIILSSSNVSTIKIMRNDGLGNFTFEDATTNGNNVPYTNRQIHIEDIDNDNFDDIILYRDRYDNQASTSSYVIIQIKNNQGNLIGNNSYIDNTGTAAVSALTFIDIDNNGYKDMFCASTSYAPHNIDETIFYYLNNGTSFQPRVYVDNQGYLSSLDRDLILEDINSDNKPDIITSFNYTKTVEYFLNNSPLSLAEYGTNNDDYTFYPVPFTNTLSWKSKTEQNFMSLEIYNIDGKKVFSKNNYQANKINLEFLVPGIYLIKIKSSNNSEITRKIIKK